LGEALTKHANWQGGQVSVGEILVMSSELTPKGPVYTILSRAKLG
jgi:2'-5' RNA ligase